MPWWCWIIFIAFVIILVLIIAYCSLRAFKNNPKYRKKITNEDIKTFDSNFTIQWYKTTLINSSCYSSNNLTNVKNTYTKKIAGVYIITNNNNQKVYVGQSYNLGLRIPQHFNDSIKGNHQIYDDYNTKFDSFKIQVIEWKKDTMPPLNQLEAGFIRLLHADSYYNYNRSLGRGKSNREIIKSKNGLKEF